MIPDLDTATKQLKSALYEYRFAAFMANSDCREGTAFDISQTLLNRILADRAIDEIMSEGRP